MDHFGLTIVPALVGHNVLFYPDGLGQAGRRAGGRAGGRVGAGGRAGESFREKLVSRPGHPSPPAAVLLLLFACPCGGGGVLLARPLGA